MTDQRWLTQQGADAILAVKVQPRASKSRFVAIEASEIKISITEPPVDGAANAAVIKFLAKTLKLPQSRIELVSGASSRHKRFRITDLTIESIQAIVSVILQKD